MRGLLTLLLAAALLAGCATPKRLETTSTASTSTSTSTASTSTASAGTKGTGAGFLQRYAVSKKLEHAVDKLEKGDLAGAVKDLNALCRGQAVPGVTDEALFRLALLSLRPSVEKPLSGQGPQLLKRLRREYPASPWTLQAAPLIELVDVADELRQQNRSLRASNHSLGRELKESNQVIKELNLVIKQLKNLDVELEQKVR